MKKLPWYRRPLKLKLGNKELTYQIDTFGSDENHDRLIKNSIRAASLLAIILLQNLSANSVLRWLVVPAIIFVGTSEIRYFRNDKKKFSLEAWR